MNDVREVSSDLEMLEISIENARKKVDLGKALERLTKNDDFKLLIMDEYLKDYAVQLVKNKCSVNQQDPDQQKFIDGQLGGIGHLDQFLRFTNQERWQAEHAIKADEETREALMQEDLGDE